MNNTLLKGLEGLKKQRKDNISSPKTIENVDIELIFKSALAKINDVYIEGTIQFISENFPGVDNQIRAMEEKIDKLWDSCLRGTSRLSDFRSAMDQYSKLYLKAIDLYKNRGKTIQKELNFNHQETGEFTRIYRS
ncbi:MAG: hypothetical protein SCARUB_01287 [Candidatus Scalindua rubra]|uniref:Uncharacterized protein n=1 Tax=Candidatus Scalindua rubra TaxID=1872076 RepID=A0A1E3XD61_9BACT|nr:MAG: hypothetical protein SCARUB_01287 [Candidatus Scalindua rubra]